MRRRNAGRVSSFTKDGLIEALKCLSRYIDTPTDLYLVGGAAMILGYGATRRTADVDAIFSGDITNAKLRRAVAAAADDLGIDHDWLNDAAKGYVRHLKLGDLILSTTTLRVFVVAPEQILAMKLCAWRDERDINDALLLIKELPIEHDAAWVLVEPFLTPGHELKAWYAFTDIWEVTYGPT